MEAEGRANAVHTDITEIVFNMVEQRWRGRWRNAGQGKELFEKGDVPLFGSETS